MVRQKQKKMSSRQAILEAVKRSQPGTAKAPVIPDVLKETFVDAKANFISVLTGIGGRVIPVYEGDNLKQVISDAFNGTTDMLSVSAHVAFSSLDTTAAANPQGLDHIEIALMDAQFGVAENGAVWLTEDQYKVRALPFICSHLAVVLHKENIVSTMHDAYQRIADASYGFGLFIAGPSKTADIEQSLVLGAHGPKTMTIFLMH
jgi:L-lactate dehydrogenase complex protein LldG